MKYVLTHYSGDWTWVKKYTDDFLIYNRTDEDIPNSIKRENWGDADYDKLTYLVDNYFDLPDVFVWSKSNLFKFITEEEFEKLKDNTDFTPLLTQNHKTYSDARGQVCYYQDGMYYERNDCWYLNSVPALYVNSWEEWAKIHMLPNPAYIPFAPGGSYILTKERVHRYARDFYENMRDMLPYAQRPGEAQLAERSYYLLWN